ncbi:MAG: hypothetical protein JJU36_06330 [Phycisphaeraceae bacterium]|nr:hypothetical protein [Phycisphaeraceae bacterium]
MTARFNKRWQRLGNGVRKTTTRLGITAALGFGLLAGAACSGDSSEAEQQTEQPPVIVLTPDGQDSARTDDRRRTANGESAPDRSESFAAADRYRAIFDRLDDEQTFRIRQAFRGMEEDDAEARSVLAAHRETIELTRAASVGVLPDWGYDLASDGISTELPQLSPMRTLGMLNSIALRQAIREHRFDDALELFTTILRLGDHAQGVENQRTMIGYMVAVSIRSMVMDPMAEAVGGMSSEQRREMMRALQQHGDIGPLSTLFHHERRIWSEWMINELTNRPDEFREQLAAFDELMAEDIDPDEPVVGFVSLLDQDREAFIRGLRRTGELLAELASFIDRRYPEAMPQVRRFIERLRDESPVAQLAIVAADGMLTMRTRSEISQAMLEAAIWRLNGDGAAFARVIDPAGDSPFTVEPVETGGFKLYSVLEDRDGDRLSMTFPARIGER